MFGLQEAFTEKAKACAAVERTLQSRLEVCNMSLFLCFLNLKLSANGPYTGS